MSKKAIRQTGAAVDHGLPNAAASQAGLGSKAELERRWLAENAEAIRLENEYIEKNGLTLERYRLF